MTEEKNEDGADDKKEVLQPSVCHNGRRHTDPMRLICYTFSFLLMICYCAYLYDSTEFHQQTEHFPSLKPLAILFDAIETYSPFHQFIKEEEMIREAENNVKSGSLSVPKLFSAEELRKYDGSEGSPGLYLAFMGQVFDVSKGQQYYGPGQGYSFFAARDASRAFVSGEFNEEGLTDDISGLSDGDYLGLNEWRTFYHKDYSYVGNLAGRYYSAQTGQPTEYNSRTQTWINEALEEKRTKQEDMRVSPPCNMEYIQARSNDVASSRRVWCTKLSGGISRDWVGVPRRLFIPGQPERCACINYTGEEESSEKGKSTTGLDHKYLKEYPNCASTAVSCTIEMLDQQE